MLLLNSFTKLKNENSVFRNFLFHIIWFSFSTLSFSIVYSQDPVTGNANNGNTNHIQWVSQFPSSDKQKKSESFFKRIGNWIAGKKEEPALVRPISILAANPDSFLIVDQGNRIIFDVEKNKGALLSIFKKNTSSFSSLVGICALPGNEILFTDSRTNKIYSFIAGGKTYKVLNDSLELQQPTGIAYSNLTDEIWVTETSAHRIAVIDRNGKLKRTIGGRGEGQGEFNFPTFICIDNDGDVYINDAMNFRIQIFNKSGKFISAFGKAGDATGYFASSKGIATDSHHNIYVVDALFNTVQIFDKAGNFLYNFGEQGTSKEQFWMPAGIYIDKKDFIYIADSYNSRVQVFQLVKGDLK